MIQTPTTVVPDPANPQSLNRYSYGLNNPVSYTDPTGHNAACASLMGGGPLGGLAALVCEVGSAIVSYWPQVQALAVEAQQLAPFAAELPATVDPNLDSQPASPSGNAGDTGDPGGLDPNDPWSGRLLTSSETRILADGATHSGNERITVIGRWRPEGGGSNYIEVAKQMNATYLDIDTSTAARLTPEQFNQVNGQFLRDAVARGDRIFLGTEIGRMVGQLAWEIEFLATELGLVLGPGGWFVPG